MHNGTAASLLALPSCQAALLDAAGVDDVVEDVGGVGAAVEIADFIDIC